MRALFSTFIALVFLAPAMALGAPASSPQSSSAIGPLPVFELHSGFWINLHHFLYQQARQQRQANSSKDPAALDAPALRDAAQGRLSKSERAAWDAAVAYYSANFAARDLLFNSDMVALRNQLGDLEDCADLSGKSNAPCKAQLPPALTAILERAAPIYRAHWWPAHDRANRLWAAGVAPLIRERGLGLAERLAEIYQAQWPLEKIRVEVSAYANREGAYTTLDPLCVTISSTDPRNQSSAGLEMIFHEASHGIAAPVQEAILRECRQRGKAIPRDLWHALLFYTTGEVIKSIMLGQPANPGDGAEQGSTLIPADPPPADPSPATKPAPGQPAKPHQYIPYAVREGLYTRGWQDYEHLLEHYWQPYLDNHSSFDDAIARMVSNL